MKEGCSLVLDVGKTNAKMTLWDSSGECIARRSRANQRQTFGAYASLDLKGIEAWVTATMREFTGLGRVATIVPVTHGAAAVLVRGDKLFAPPLDYEADIPDAVRAAYVAERDPFAATGSPLLPQGLNLGVQLAHLEAMTGPWPSDVWILLWPQYWAWRFSGVMASEVSSLGCHTDLWRPIEGRFSELATARDWARRFPPLYKAGEVLGPATDEWVAVAGL